MSARIRIHNADGTETTYPTTSLIDGTNYVMEMLNDEAMYVTALDSNRFAVELVAIDGTVREVEVVA